MPRNIKKIIIKAFLYVYYDRKNCSKKFQICNLEFNLRARFVRALLLKTLKVLFSCLKINPNICTTNQSFIVFMRDFI